MTPLFVVAWFVVCIVGTYAGMRTICFLKRTYTGAENRVLRWLVVFLELLETACTGCRESCESHPLLVRRAFRIGVIIAVLTTTAWFVARC